MHGKITIKCQFVEPETDDECQALLTSIYNQNCFRDTAILIMKRVKEARQEKLAQSKGEK